MMKKLLFSLLLCLLAVPLSAQQSEAEREAMYYIRKAYDYSRERKTEEAFKYVKLFETYLDQNLSPETTSDSLAYLYGTTILTIGERSDKDNPIHWDKVYRYLIRSAERGVPSAMVAVGLSCANLNKENESLKWYNRAVDLGSTDAQFYLGVHYWTAKKFDVARQWLLKADAQGYTLAALFLGLIYGEGQGVEKNDKIAVEYFRKAARGGSSVAQMVLEMRGIKW